VIHERDGRTDGQTDTAWQHIDRACTASRGKKYVYSSNGIVDVALECYIYQGKVLAVAW